MSEPQHIEEPDDHSTDEPDEELVERMGPFVAWAREQGIASDDLVLPPWDESEPFAARAAGDGASGGHLGQYRLERELGRGGQGVVYLARDTVLDRDVALKVLPEALGRLSESKRKRFAREARIGSRLEISGICPVYDAGVIGDVRFIAMRLLRGQPLSHAISRARHDGVTLGEAAEASGAAAAPASGSSSRSPSSSRRRGLMFGVEVVEKVARAVHEAHKERVVHRDLKPANVFIERDGHPVIVDFGCARDEQDEAGPLTATDDILGTAAYMSPEQVAGGPVTHASDVFSLGVTLYECLTLRNPFERASLYDVYEAIRHSDPPSVTTLVASVGRDLAVVVQTALEKSVDRRYPTALDLAEDLRAVREHRPVRARPVGRLTRLWRWTQRNPLLAASLALTAVSLIAGMVVSLVFALDARRERDEKQDALDQKQEALDFLGIGHLRDEADVLWPQRGDLLASYDLWLGRARAVLRREPEARAELARLENGSIGDPGNAELAERRRVLARFVDEIGDLWALLDDIGRRREVAATLRRRSIDDHAEAWARCAAAVAAAGRYGGLRLPPQIGLVPLGADRASGLQEFLHLETHGADTIPARDDGDGVLPIDESTGIIFVLIPGGSFDMGSDDEGTPKQERPVDTVTLAPFFLAKHEMSQAQWVRFTGNNPSGLKAGRKLQRVERPITSLHPVEHVTWERCATVLARLALSLPTEAQWEYAARAGTETRWWTGDDPEGLSTAANLADLTAHRAGAAFARETTLAEDGFAVHAPVTALAANPFGLHGIIGNVWEWCLDRAGRYEDPVRDGTGERLTEAAIDRRVFRGGAYDMSANHARSAYRGNDLPSGHTQNRGLRPARSVDP